MTNFINPYNFVRANGEPLRETVKWHDSFDNETYSGVLICTLTTKTRMFIPDTLNTVEQRNKHRIFKKVIRNARNHPIIPATSLKGVFRAVAEAVSNSCFSILALFFDYKIENPRTRQETTMKIDQETFIQKLPLGEKQLPCEFDASKKDNEKKLCPCCRIFGMTSNKGSFRGKVFFEDAEGESEKIESKPIIIQPSSPRPHNWRFYINYNDVSDFETSEYQEIYEKEKTKIRGRKFFYHFQPKELDDKFFLEKPRNKKTITINETIQQDYILNFLVTFVNLTAFELGLLIWAIELENNLAHKIGMGKPIGFGSAKISIDSSDIKSSSARYKNETGTTYKKDKFKNDFILKIKSGKATNQSYQDLCKILKYDNNRTADSIHYPNRRRWSENKKKYVLGTIDDIEHSKFFLTEDEI